MKKYLLPMLLLVVSMACFAQKPIVVTNGYDKQMAPVPHRVAPELPMPSLEFPHETMTRPRATTLADFEEYVTMTTIYDYQSNASLGNRIAVWDDGTAAVVATWAVDQGSWYTRGTGYNYYNGSYFDYEPEERIEEEQSGWPSIAPLGNGEILASATSSGIKVYRRTTKGQGDWTDLGYPNDNDFFYPRICTSGTDHQNVFLIGCKATDSLNLYYDLCYMRSTDGGSTWSDLANPPLIDALGEYNGLIHSDEYVMASNGDDIAILFAGQGYDLFYIISHDNGETWEKQIIARTTLTNFDWNQTEVNYQTDSIWWHDQSASITIDGQGTVHVAFGVTRWSPYPEWGAGYYTYWPFTIGIVYWNSLYVNEQGTHEILPFGQWSGDEGYGSWWSQTGYYPYNNGINGISNTMHTDRIWALAEEDGHEHLHLTGFIDENGDGVTDYSEYWENNPGNWHYQLGIANSPGIAINNDGGIAIIFTVLSETRINYDFNFYYNSAYMVDNGFWGVVDKRNWPSWEYEEMTNLSNDFMHMYDDVWSTTAYPNANDFDFWFAYQADGQLYQYVLYPSVGITDNYIYAIHGIIPDGVNELCHTLTDVSVRPNPTNGPAILDLNSMSETTAEVSITDLTGRVVMTMPGIYLKAGNNTINLDVEALSPGMYFATISSDGQCATAKFVMR